MKKPFNKTRFGNFLTNTATGKLLVGGADFFTGGIVSNIVEETPQSPSGSADKMKVVGTLLISLLLIYLVSNGTISLEEAEQLEKIGK
tara:strand:+ start:374 stop:637 length:264 start_codon:yes stop_codon:yes gene_type:complete